MLLLTLLKKCLLINNLPALANLSTNINSFVENADQPSNEEPDDINSSYVSPSSILPFPKASPRKNQTEEKGKQEYTLILLKETKWNREAWGKK